MIDIDRLVFTVAVVVLMMALALLMVSIPISATLKPSAGDYVLNRCDGLDDVTVSSPEALTAWEMCLNEALQDYKKEYE